MARYRFFLGCDGGGTSTRARLTNASHEVLGEGRAGPGTLRFGIDSAADAIIAASREAFRAAGVAEHHLAHTSAGIGLAASELASNRAQFAQWRHPFARAVLRSDCEIACIGAHGGRGGGIVIVGTGSVGYVMSAQGNRRFGGMGFPATDGGSGGQIGLACVQRALRTFDENIGLSEASAFRRAVLNDLGTSQPVIAEKLATATATDYARIARRAFQFASQGDEEAIAVVQQAAQEIARLVRLVHEHGANSVCLMGGLSATIRPYLPPSLDDLLAAPQADAVSGALWIAQQGCADDSFV